MNTLLKGPSPVPGAEIPGMWGCVHGAKSAARLEKRPETALDVGVRDGGPGRGLRPCQSWGSFSNTFKLEEIAMKGGRTRHREQ